MHFLFFSFYLFRDRADCPTFTLRQNRCVTRANGADGGCERQTGAFADFKNARRHDVAARRFKRSIHSSLCGVSNRKWVTKKQLPVVAQRLFFSSSSSLLSVLTCIEFNYCARRLSSLRVEASCLFLKNIQRVPGIRGRLGLVEAAFCCVTCCHIQGGEKSIGN